MSKPAEAKFYLKPYGMQPFRKRSKENTYTFINKEKTRQTEIDPYNQQVDKVPDDKLKKAGGY